MKKITGKRLVVGILILLVLYCAVSICISRRVLGRLNVYGQAVFDDGRVFSPTDDIHGFRHHGRILGRLAGSDGKTIYFVYAVKGDAARQYIFLGWPGDGYFCRLES